MAEYEPTTITVTFPDEPVTYKILDTLLKVLDEDGENTLMQIKIMRDETSPGIAGTFFVCEGAPRNVRPMLAAVRDGN